MSRIIVENISKHFKIYRRPQDRLAEILFRKQKHELFRVLNDISFALEDGESVGIVGINGAGKSTLLKILYTPSLESIFGKSFIASLGLLISHRTFVHDK